MPQNGTCLWCVRWPRGEAGSCAVVSGLCRLQSNASSAVLYANAAPGFHPVRLQAFAGFPPTVEGGRHVVISSPAALASGHVPGVRGVLWRIIGKKREGSACCTRLGPVLRRPVWFRSRRPVAKGACARAAVFRPFTKFRKDGCGTVFRGPGSRRRPRVMGHRRSSFRRRRRRSGGR